MEIHQLAEKQILELKPLEMVAAKDLGVGQGWSILRVPGGWIFIFIDSACFVAEPAPPRSTRAPSPSASAIRTDPVKKPAKKKTTKKAKTENGS